MVELANAEAYFSEEVFDNSAWVNSDESTKNRALKNATNVLSRHYGNRNIPDQAVFEQALWIMKVSEARKQAEIGVTSYSVDGISVSLSQVDRTISPVVVSLLGRRIGKSTSGRQGWIHSRDRNVNLSLGRDME